jgi:hypothetical protein
MLLQEHEDIVINEELMFEIYGGDQPRVEPTIMYIAPNTMNEVTGRLYFSCSCII